MTAESLLITYVQIGVAISGFSGIVVSLGNRGQGEWSHRDRQLLYALLGMSGGVHATQRLTPGPGLHRARRATVRSASSGCSVILQLVLMVVRARQVVRDADTLARERWVLAGAYAGGVMCVAAQLVNCVWLGVAWPHLATITFYLAVSFIVFVRLVQPEARP